MHREATPLPTEPNRTSPIEMWDKRFKKEKKKQRSDIYRGRGKGGGRSSRVLILEVVLPSHRPEYTSTRA